MKPLQLTPEARPAIIAPVQAESLSELAEVTELASHTPGIDILEWRVDAFLAAIARENAPADEPITSASGDYVPLLTVDHLPDRAQLHEMYRHLKATGIPVLVTMRTAREGGLVALSSVGEGEQSIYTRIIIDLLSLEPAAIDIELARWDSDELVERARNTDTYVIVSQHDWAATPSVSEIARRFEEMQALGAHAAKQAVMPGTLDDTLDLLAGTLAADDALKIPVIGVAMGTLGRASRVLGHEYGSAATFASLDRASAPGQLTVQQLRTILDQLPEEEYE